MLVTSLTIKPHQPMSLITCKLFQTNFAIQGNPTPVIDSLITARWDRYTVANQEFMDINENLIPSRRPHGGRLEQWHTFQNRFAPW